jgi:glutaredoxin
MQAKGRCIVHKVTIMSKPGCKLCKQAVDVVQKIVGAHVATLIEEIDITQNQDLLAKYKNDIPVVLIDGVERFRHTIDPEKLAGYFMDEPGESLLGIS